MATDEITRLHYYQRQYLGADDFEAQQEYHRDMRRRHNLGPHTWGIVTGLELVERPQEGNPQNVDIFLQPGLAIDGFGREIVVFSPTRLDTFLFVPFGAGNVDVWLAYNEQKAGLPRAGYEQCEIGGQYSRLLEDFLILAGPQPTPTHDNLSVDGKKGVPPVAGGTLAADEVAIPQDESVPYQEFSDDANSPRWLVKLGMVHWDGKQEFEPAASGVLTDGRPYAAAVAAELLASAGTLRLRPRQTPADPDAADFASVEGRLRVDGRLVAKHDVFLHGTRLSFQTSGGEDNKSPLWLQRSQGGAGQDLHINIGDGTVASSLTVGPTVGSTQKTFLVVKDDDTVLVATGALDFGSQTRQMINLWSTADGKHHYGIGVQSGTTYFRSHDQFCWFKDGVHSDSASDPGANGSLQMRLDSQARLYFGSTVRQMLNLYNQTYGIGVQSSTLYFRSNADFCWFRGGSHDKDRSDPGGGSLAMKLDNQNHLTVNGKASVGDDVVIGNNTNATLTVRHINGKQTNTNSNDNLYLNWGTGKDVHVGNVSGAASDLVVSGDVDVRGDLKLAHPENVIKVRTYVRVVDNQGQNNPVEWTVNHAGEFTQIYDRFVVLQGFSLWGNNSITFNNWGHVESDGAIPQHAFIRIKSSSLSSTSGEAYCSESDAGLESDNSILFTLVVLGRKD